MRILLTIVHHWNPEGSGMHGSLRPDPAPRIAAFEQQLLCLQRLGARQFQLNMQEMEAQPANQAFQHQIHIKIITDGKHHVLDRLASPYRGLFQMVITAPPTARHLGFEAQRFLANNLEEGYDLYGYLEDDLLINDPLFFHKINWFRQHLGDQFVLLPHRMELPREPHWVEKFYIDGPLQADQLKAILPEKAASLAAESPGGRIHFESPKNPHAGCFFLSRTQLAHWKAQDWWQDGDCSWVSPLESAATLGIAKTFTLYKPVMAQAAWLELQHWGQSFHCLLGRSVALPREPSKENQAIAEPVPESQPA